MKKLILALFIACGFTAPAFADSSICIVFLNGAPDHVVTTCDGKEEANVQFDFELGYVAPFTKEVQKVLKNGYKIASCSAVTASMTCSLTK